MGFERISRREFLKLAGLAGVAIATEQLPELRPVSADPEERKLELEPNPLKHAVNLPCLEYHDPEFNAGKDACMTKEVFKAQLEFLRIAGYYTPTAKEVSGFLRGEKLLPYNSVALRFDLGTDKIDPSTGKSYWYEVFQNLEEKGLHGIIFLIPQAVESLPNGIDWKTIADYVNRGVISIGSHELPDHPDYRSIKADYALYSMRTSREILLEMLKKSGVKNPQVLGFAFPFDAVPDNAQELTKEAGYEFCTGGTTKNALDSTKFGSSKTLASIKALVGREQLERTKSKPQPNLALLPIAGTSLSLPDYLTTGKGIEQDPRDYQVNLWQKMLIPRDAFTGKLIIPQLIIVHTDSQPRSSRGWNSKTTFKGINGEYKIAVTFGVDSTSVLNFVPIYWKEGKILIPEPKQESQAASGVGASINIEMAGSEFDKILTSGDEEKKLRVIRTIKNTARLIEDLIGLSNGNLDPSKVLGHYEISVKGKSDPGKEAMRLLREFLKKDN